MTNIMFTALQISSFFIKKGVTPLKLQKLLYYAQVWYYAKNKKKLFKDNIEAWVLGPVVENVWQNFKFMRRGDVIKEVKAENVNLDENVMRHLAEIWEVYGKFTGLELVDLTHQEELWANARQDLLPNQNSKNIIPIDDGVFLYKKLSFSGNIPLINQDIEGKASFTANGTEELF